MNTRKIVPANRLGKSLSLSAFACTRRAKRTAGGCRIGDAGGRERHVLQIPAPRILHPASLLLFIGAWSLVIAPARAAEPPDPRAWVTQNMPKLIELYRHLHQNPELSKQEKETAARMAKELRDV